MLGRNYWVGVAALLLAACSTPVSAPDDEVAIPVSLTGCFASTVGDANAYLNLTEVDGAVHGTMEYAFAQKDSTWGLVTGLATDTEVTVEYQYISEGVLSTRSLTWTRNETGLEGEGFTYSPSDSCGIGSGWSATNVTVAQTTAVHDPENGYFARMLIAFSGMTTGFDYRCIAAVTDDSGTNITEWVGFGSVDAKAGTKPVALLSNIQPDQMDAVSAGTATCQVRTR